MTQTADVLTSKLSTAVSLTDKFSGKQPIGKVVLTLKDEPNKPLKNPSGFYLFFNLANQLHIIQVRSDYYFDVDFPVTLTDVAPDSQLNDKLTQILQNISLDPNASYPFPNGTTLIRGSVLTQQGQPIPNAKVAVVEKNMNAHTTENGEYVFYFANLAIGDIDDNGYVKSNSNSTLLTVRAEVNGVTQEVTVFDLKEGTSKSAHPIKF